MKPAESYDVIIIGAGPVGSAGASLAARHGLRCLVVDESNDVFPLPRAIHFDADAMRIFQFAGVAERVEPLTRATSGGVHLGADGAPIREFRVPDAPGDLGWRPHYMFLQPHLDAELRQAAAEAKGVDARFGWRCEAVHQDADEVRVVLLDPDGNRHEAYAPYVIAADGASSQTRKQVGIELSDYGFDEPWIIVDIEVPDEDLGPDYTIMYCDPARPATYVPGPGKHRRWEFLVLPGETGEDLITPTAIRQLIAGLTPWLDVETIEIYRVALYRFHAIVAAQWRASRVFLAGDAAHQTPPFYGQGMCHGLRDMRNLLWKIAAVLNGRCDEALLDSYQAEREPHVRAIIEAAVNNGRYISTLDPKEAAERDRELRSRMGQGQDVRSFRAVIPGLECGLLDPESESDAVGLLFVQPPVRRVDGSTTLLDDVLADSWALVTTVEPEPGGDIERRLARLGGRLVVVGDLVEDLDGTLEIWFDTFGAVAALVRPDRYVFGTARSADGIPSLLARLEAILPLADTGEKQPVA